MKQLLVSASVVAMLGGTAMAADLPVMEAPAPIYSPTPMAYNWTGFYVGLQAGYGWGNVEGEADVGGPDVPPTTGDYDYDIDGFLGGVHLGYNHQFNNFVLGVEGDVEYASLDGSGGGDDPDISTFYHETELDWLASLRLRAGFAIDRLLIYGTGGIAWAHIDQAFGEDGDPELDDGDRSRWGWTLGAGAEYAFANNWTARAEYRYYDLGDDDVSGVDYSDDNDITLHTVRLGASYKF